MTPADLIVKALRDLAQALKRRRNMKGFEQIKALTKIDELLNNILTTNKTPTRKVAFDEATKPPQEVLAAPRVNNMSKSAMNIQGSIQQSLTSHLSLTHTNKTPILDMPPPRVVESPKADREKITLDPNRIKL